MAARPTACSCWCWSKPIRAGRSSSIMRRSVVLNFEFRSAPSDRQNLFLLRLEQLFHAFDLRVGELLNLIIRALLVVGRDQFVLGRLLYLVVAVAADVADRRLVVFQHA